MPITDVVVSRHPLALEMAGLIKGETTIYNSYCFINWDVFRILTAFNIANTAIELILKNGKTNEPEDGIIYVANVEDDF